MPDTSKYWREVDNMSDDIEYLYGNYAGKKKTGLSRDIEITENILDNQKQSREERLEELFDRENWNRLKAMPVKDMAFSDCEIYSEIKKKYSNSNKSYDDSDMSPETEGGIFPDITVLRSQIINTANELIPMIRSRGISVQPIPEGASLQNILSFCHAFRDALKNSQATDHLNKIASVEIESPVKYTKAELQSTRQAIDGMLENGEYIRG